MSIASVAANENLPPPTPAPGSVATAGAGWKILVMIAALVVGAAPFIWPLVGVVDGPVSEGTWMLIKISAAANLLIILYHYTAPAHPKFTMIPWRKWILRTHIISGTTELFAGITALFFSTGSPVPGVIMAVAALGFHIPSASFQTPIVFGAKAIMAPAYILCIALHAFCAVNLLLHPTSVLWAVNTFLVFNIYVWCRIYFYAFDTLKLFSSMKYTIAILAAGVTVVPAVLGPLTFVALAIFIGVYVILYRKFFIRSTAEYADFVREKARDAALSPEMLALWDRAPDPQEDAKAARRCFELLDTDRDGSLGAADLESAFGSAQMPAAVVATFLRARVGAERVNFAQFSQHLWSIDTVRQRARRIAATMDATSERDRAELVFRQLDVDRKGQIGPGVLRLLLSEWGLPESEAARYLKRVDTNGDGLIDFDDFFTRMRPVWRYIYFDIYQAEAAQEETDMLRRLLSSNKEAGRAKRMMKTVQEELLSKVPFLANGTAQLISDLGSSLVREELANNAVLFAEGSSGERFYVIESGSLRISKGGTVITVLGAGGCFGEGALLSDERRSATVDAVEKSVIHSLSRSSFEYVLQRHPGVRDELVRLHHQRVTMAVKRSLEGELLARVPFLRSAGREVIDALAAALRPSVVAPGTKIIVDGQQGDQFFLVEEGQVRISKQGQIIAELGAGACLGEGALISNEPRSATATAMEETRLLSMDRKTFEQVLAAFPAVHAEIVSLHHARRATSAAPFRVEKT